MFLWVCNNLYHVIPQYHTFYLGLLWLFWVFVFSDEFFLLLFHVLVKNVVEISMGIALDLLVTLINMAIFTTQSPQMHEHGRSFYVLIL